MNIDGVDLNLLHAFNALTTEPTVTGAARKLGVSQPAMSHSLNRLRELLRDDVLVRTSQGMVLTPRARELVPQVQQALGILEAALTPARLDPFQLKRTFTIGMADYTELLGVPRLAARLATEAPQVKLVCVKAGGSELLQQLESGDADLWIGVTPPGLTSLYSQKLLGDDFMCAIRKGHPLAGKRMTAKQFAALRHIQIAPGNTDGGPLDNALSVQKLSRLVAIRLPHFLVAPHLVAQSDMVLTAPRRLLNTFARQLQLRLFECPVHVPGFTLVQVWHQRFHQDPVHRWFRQVVQEAMQSIDARQA